MAYFEIDVQLWLSVLEDRNYTTDHRQLLRVWRYGLSRNDYEIARPALLKVAEIDDDGPSLRLIVSQFISHAESHPPVLGLYDIAAILRADEVQPQADDWRAMANGRFYGRVQRAGTLVMPASEDSTRPERIWTMVGERAELSCD